MFRKILVFCLTVFITILLVGCSYNMKYEKEARTIWKNHVPKSGQSNTIEGEMIRAIEKLRYEAQNNGNGNWDDRFEMFCDYLWENLNDEEVFNEKTLKKIKSDIDTLRKGDGQYPYLANDIYDRLTDRVIEWTFVNKGPNAREIDPKQYR